jgi:transcriptional regulator NrdR
MKVLANLKILREEKGLSQRDLAQRSGVAQATIGQLERCERAPRPSTLHKIAKGLGVGPAEFMFLFGAPDADTLYGEKGRWEAAGKGELEWYVAGKGYPPSAELASDFTNEDLDAQDFDTVDESLAALHLRDYLGGWSDSLYTRDPQKRTVEEILSEARERLDSNRPEDVSKASEVALAGARQITENINKRGREYEALPRRYYEDPSSARRIEKLRAALHHYQRAALEAIEELLKVHSEALHRLGESTTYGRREPLRLTVLKRDGSREPFDRAKLRTGLTKACAERPVPEEAIEIAVDEIEAELRRRRTHEVTSRRLGDLALLRLRKIDLVSYLRFASMYRQHSDEDELKENPDVGQFLKQVERWEEEQAREATEN